jgi:glutamine cyclotransferase
VDTYPHDPAAFTQGLVYQDGWLYEGTGLRGESSLRRVDLVSGDVQQFIELPDQYFGEGITIYGDKIYQLTWQSNVGFVYDLETFERIGEFTYPTEGWGLTHDGEHLIMSDGTALLYYLSPDTLEIVDQVEVTVDGETALRASIPGFCFPFGERTRVYVEPAIGFNELEYIEGEIWANVWASDCIARIDPQSGHLTSWIDLTHLLAQTDVTRPVDVLNGIAYDAHQDRLFVTGKLWPNLFQIEITQPSEAR